MPDIKHPKCGAKMQRVYKRVDSAFVSFGWVCTDCGLLKRLIVTWKHTRTWEIVAQNTNMTFLLRDAIKRFRVPFYGT
jgi:hypothetical protein